MKAKKKIVVYNEDIEDRDIEVERIGCCGIYEINNLVDKDISPATVLVKVVDELLREYPMVIFHDATKFGNGKRLCTFIRGKKLGKVHASDKKMNPNSQNEIQMWIWYPNWDKLRTFLDEKVEIKESRYEDDEDDY